MNKAITTAILAWATGVKSESIRTHFYRKGHYYGLKPTKLPNGHLIWPVDSVERLTGNSGGES